MYYEIMFETGATIEEGREGEDLPYHFLKNYKSA